MKNLRNDEQVYSGADDICDNCTQCSLGVSPKLWTYTYNAENRFVETQNSSSKTQNFSFNIQHSSFIINFEYSPFGKITRTTGNIASRFAFRFSSEYFDIETGLVYYNYRYYSPELGRWLSRDPIRERGGVNLYGMVGNAPVIWRDWLGLDSGEDWYEGWDRTTNDLSDLINEDITLNTVGNGTQALGSGYITSTNSQEIEAVIAYTFASDGSCRRYDIMGTFVERMAYEDIRKFFTTTRTHTIYNQGLSEMLSTMDFLTGDLAGVIDGEVNKPSLLPNPEDIAILALKAIGKKLEN